METNKSSSSGLKQARSFPKPVKIISAVPYKILALWNTGEVRLNDFDNEIDEWLENSFLEPLANHSRFVKVAIVDKTFGWEEPAFFFEEAPNEAMPRTIDPVRAYRNSKLIQAFEPEKKVAQIIKSERIKAGLTQIELAARLGYSSKYISKIERGVSDIQFGVLEYILIVGFEKDLVVTSYDDILAA